MRLKECRGNRVGIPFGQMARVGAYVLKQQLSGRKRYPLVLMLEPLFRCNLACAGCGKIQYPAHILKKELSPEECFKAVDECAAPMVSIPGGEPLMHSQIDKIVEGLVARHRRQNRGDALREHRLPAARRPDEQDVVSARGRDLERALREQLSAHIGKVGAVRRRSCRVRNRSDLPLPAVSGPDCHRVDQR